MLLPRAFWLAALPFGVLGLGALAPACKKEAVPPPAPPPPPPAAVEAREAPKPPQGMVFIPPGRFAMGSDDEMFPDARPIHPVSLDGFFIDETEVTNTAFAAFVAATAYETIAERRPDPKDFPGVPPEALVPGSVAFHPPDHPVALDDHSQWWAYEAGVDWQHPEGPQSAIAERQDHPVVHVAWLDAQAYCAWAHKRLPTEAEWEYAARGGLAGKRFAWGDDPKEGGQWMANVWQGRFPSENTAEDGFARTAPVRRYKPNGYGLYDVAGNVWEWVQDYYRPDAYAHSPNQNPKGPNDSFDPNEPGMVKRVMRGGSYLCSDLYCVRYVVGSRGKGAEDTGSSHVGFRCARDL
ncbi:MAG: formylglycine-generating enzyme family protein [Myxococcales bacterium]|nr:formylglycine-generating enzyme family protein [Myxococcales bacterium]